MYSYIMLQNVAVTLLMSLVFSSEKLSPPHFSAQFTSKASSPLSSSFPL